MSVGHETPVDAAERQTHSVVNRFYDSALRGDIDAISEILHPDVVVYEAASLPYAGAHTGRFQCLGALAAVVLRDRPRLRRPVAMYSFGLSGPRHSSRFPSDSGNSAETQTMPIVETFVVRDGLIVEIRPYYFDTAAIAAALATQPAQGPVASGQRGVKQ